MLSLRTCLSVHQIRHQLIVSHNKPILSSIINNNNNEYMNERHILEKYNNCSPIIMSKRFGRRYRKWHHWPNDFLPFYWERQRRVPGFLNSGDEVQDIGTWDPKALVLDAVHSQELKNAPEAVRRQFTLEFAERKDIVKFQSYHIMKEMQRHPMDFTSPEARITNMTVKIRNLLHHFLKVDYWAAPLKTVQTTLINRRAKLLTELYYTDIKRYHFVINKLKISHTPPKLGEIIYKPTRKGELRRLTREYCENIKNQKLEQYHQKLIEEQKIFMAKKDEIEKWIQNEEKFLGLTVNESKKR